MKYLVALLILGITSGCTVVPYGYYPSPVFIPHESGYDRGHHGYRHASFLEPGVTYRHKL